MEWWQIIIAIILFFGIINGIEREIKRWSNRISDLEDRVSELEDKLGPESDVDYPMIEEENEEK